MTAPTAGPRTFTARTPADVLALVPVLLGFTPQDSIVMLTFGGSRSFHARVDLPRGHDDHGGIDEVVTQLLGPVRRHGVGRVVLVLYTGDPVLASRLTRRLSARFGRAGVELVAALRAHEGRWWAGRRERADFTGPGVPYDVSIHPLVVEAVVGGTEILGSRQQLVDAMAHDPALGTGVLAALAEGPRAPTGDPRAEVVLRVAEGVARCAEAGGPPDDHAVAWLLRALLDPAARDAVVDLVTRETARLHVAWWTEVVRRSPDALVAAPAGLLAFAAWQAGDGARAWCAVDRCLAAAPDDRFAHLLAATLAGAVPPDAWAGDPDGGSDGGPDGGPDVDPDGGPGGGL